MTLQKKSTPGYAGKAGKTSAKEAIYACGKMNHNLYHFCSYSGMMNKVKSSKFAPCRKNLGLFEKLSQC